MTKQLAKTVYDYSKLMFASWVVASALKGGWVYVVSGILATFGLLLVAILIEHIADEEKGE